MKTGVFVVIAVLGVTYVLWHYIGVGQAVLGRRYTVYLDLPDSGGLFSSASVTYRGVEIGRVGAIRLRHDGIRVALDITSNRRIPAATRAVVGNGSPIGEQFVDLRPTRSGPPYLRDGSVIAPRAAALPVSTQELLVAVDRLVRSVPRGDLHTLVTELGRGFAGTGPELRALLVSTRRLVRSANAALPATGRLIARGGRVLDTQNDLAGDITTFANGLARFTDALRSGDHDLRRVIKRAVPAARQVSALERDVGTTLPALLDDLTGLGHVVEPRVAALRQILVIYPYVVSTSFGLFPGNGSTRFGVPIPPAEDHQPCKKGYLDPSKRRLPTALDYPPIRWNSFCKESTKADVAVRGARMAPQPDGSRLGDDPSYDANTGLPGGTMTRSWRWLLLGDFF